MLILLAAAVLLQAGCTVRGHMAKYTRSLSQAHGVSVNSIVIARDKLLSFGRRAGDSEVEIKSVEELLSAEFGERWRVRFLIPADQKVSDLGSLRAFLETGMDEFARAVDKTLKGYLSFVELPLELDIVLATEPGSYYSSRVDIRERLLISLLKDIPPGKSGGDAEKNARWWAGLAGTTAHEFFHLHHNLNDSKVAHLDDETAAHLVGACAQLFYAQNKAAESKTDLLEYLEEPDAGRYFPQMAHGQLAPDLEQLDELFADSLKGDYIARAVLYLIAGKREISPAEDRDAFERIFDYCDGLIDEVPRFHLGEWQAGLS